MTDNRMKSIYQKRTRIGDNILKVLIYLAAGVAIADVYKRQADGGEHQGRQLFLKPSIRYGNQGRNF